MTSTLSRRAADGAVETIATFAEAAAPGPWLVVVPHDDDMVLGMGLVAQAARQQGIVIDVAIVSDGRMGYAEPSEREQIQAIRRREMEASCRLLDIPSERLHWLGFPDSDLPSWRGRRFGADGKATGIAHALTGLIRRLAPGSVFGPTRADLHPDHSTVAEELAISCYHASGEIWLELGAPVPVPERWDYAVYCSFPGEPTLQVHADQRLLDAKLAGIAAFASQRQITRVIEAQRRGGPYEYVQRSDWQPYSPTQYRHLFPASGAETGRAYAADCARTLPLIDAWKGPWEPLRTALADSARTPLLIVGEGSSRLFPAAVACALARRAGGMRIEHLGGREAQALDLARWQVVAISNSGRTREVVDLAERLRGHPRLLALVGQPGGRLTELVKPSLALLDAPEGTVAATVSVYAQALALAHAVAAAGNLPVPLAALRAATARALSSSSPLTPSDLARVRRVWWSGAECGPAGELALKTMETAGILGVHLPGSMALHGVEEVMDGHDLVVAFAPDVRDLDGLRSRIGATGARLLLVGPGEQVDAPSFAEGAEWAGFVHLALGWRLLGHLATALGRDPDKPRRARKVGNEWQPKAAAAS
jgi:LmbE family N-acetylglucosaminyl deacetylase/fructoselysine-6-P-deglycase FrlB-like protein